MSEIKRIQVHWWSKGRIKQNIQTRVYLTTLQHETQIMIIKPKRGPIKMQTGENGSCGRDTGDKKGDLPTQVEGD